MLRQECAAGRPPTHRMKHLEADPIGAPRSNPSRPRKPRNAASLATIFVALLVAVAAGGYAMSSLMGPTQHDQVSSAQKAELIAQFTKLRAVAIEPVSAGDIDKVLDEMKLDPLSRRALKGNLEKPALNGERTVMAKLVLWDWMAQDGDVVRVSSAGYTVDVPLLKAQTVVTIPVDGSRTIQLTGVNDGGGGITLGVQSGDGLVSLPVLANGQVLSLPVSL